MKTTKIIVIALSTLVLGSCATSSDVVDGGLFQKRKYNKGWNINKKSKAHNSGDLKSEKEEILYTEEGNNSSEKTIIYEKNTEISVVEDALIKDEDRANEQESVQPTQVVSSMEINSTASIHTTKRNLRKHFSTDKFHKISEVSNTSGDVELLILVILALLLPPLAVGIYEGITTRFWITLILWLLAWGVGGLLFGFGLAGLCSILAVIYALLIVLGAI